MADPLTQGLTLPSTSLFSGSNGVSSGLSLSGGSLTNQGSAVTTPTSNTSALAGGSTSFANVFGSAAPAGTSPYTYNPSGSISFPTSPAITAAAKNPVAAAPATTSGGGVAMDASNQPVGYTPGYSVNTDSTIPSDALGSTMASTDISAQRNKYADYVKALAQANGYSPDYLAAYERSQTLGAQEAQLRGDLATGAAPGDTQGYAEGFTNQAEMGAGAQKAFADIALQTQTLLRQGNIAGAKALVDAYAPTSVAPGSSLVSPVTGDTTFSGLGGYTGVQAVQTYNNLQQTYPDANIPAYDPSKSPTDNLQIAQNAASQSPSFQSKSTIPVTLPGGGYALVNKNQVAGYRPDGTAIIVSPAQAAQAGAAQSTIADLTKQRADTASAITTADSNFPLLLKAVQSAGLNSNAPLINEIQQNIANKTSQSQAMAALNVLVPSLQTEYSRIIARGGSVDDKTRSAAQSIVNGTYTLAQLQAVYNVVKAEGQNVLKGYDTEIKAQTDSLNSLYNTSSSSGSTNASVGSSWANL